MGAPRYITFGGKTLSLTAWARRLGISAGAMHGRLERQPISLALTLPPQRKASKPRPITYKGVTLSLSGWAHRLGIRPGTLHGRLATGEPYESALTRGPGTSGGKRGSATAECRAIHARAGRRRWANMTPEAKAALGAKISAGRAKAWAKCSAAERSQAAKVRSAGMSTKARSEQTGRLVRARWATLTPAERRSETHLKLSRRARLPDGIEAHGLKELSATCPACGGEAFRTAEAGYGRRNRYLCSACPYSATPYVTAALLQLRADGRGAEADDYLAKTETSGKNLRKLVGR